jgi:hypothetical protein
MRASFVCARALHKFCSSAEQHLQFQPNPRFYFIYDKLRNYVLLGKEAGVTRAPLFLARNTNLSFYHLKPPAHTATRFMTSYPPALSNNKRLCSPLYKVALSSAKNREMFDRWKRLQKFTLCHIRACLYTICD